MLQSSRLTNGSNFCWLTKTLVQVCFGESNVSLQGWADGAGRSGHRVGVLCLLKTTPSAGAVHVAGLCDRDWVQRNTLGNATQAIKQKITRQTWGMYKQKNISHFLLDKLDFNLNYVFVYKVFCKIIPILNTQHKTSGKTWSPIVRKFIGKCLYYSAESSLTVASIFF